MRKIFYILILLLFPILRLHAVSEYYFKQLSLGDGLSHPTVNSILCDKNGYIWIGTMSGLNRFDKYEIKSYFNEENDSSSLYSNKISFIKEDECGNLWIGAGVLSLYNSKDDNFSIVKYNGKTIDASSACLVDDGIILGGWSLFKYSYSTKQITQLIQTKQIKDKFKNITVAVDEDRCHGIDKLLETGEKRPDIILLDDAFQHRYVKPGLSILLTSYDKIITEDCLLPAGRLREQASGIERADIIIVTKCPDDMSPIDFRIKHNELNPYPYQKLFFTTFKYGNLVNIVNSDCRKKLCEITRKDSIVLLTGIANPKPMIDRLSCHSDNIVLMDFPDHHNFSSDDLKRIIKTFEKCESEKKYIITTEKDAARLKLHIKAFENIADSIFILPIEVEFLLNQGNMFNKIIEDYVRKNSRDGSVH